MPGFFMDGVGRASAPNNASFHMRFLLFLTTFLLNSLLASGLWPLSL